MAVTGLCGFRLSHFGPKARTPKLVRQGTHRAQGIERTVAHALRLAPVMGITRVANVTGLDVVGLPVVMVCRPNSRSVAVSQGKGIDLPSARASGLMEAAELYHAETITRPLRLCSYEELCYQHNVLPIAQLPLIGGSRFHRNLRLLWCEGHDLLAGENIFVPYELVHTNYTVPFPSGHGCFAASSNGLASGNCIVEAVSHAICELIERDATTLWQLRGEKRWQWRRVDLTAINDAVCTNIIQRFESAGLSVFSWDITTNIGIAAFACLLLPRENTELWHCSISEGYGCHPAREIALARALTEAAQARLTVISGIRDDFQRDAYREWLDGNRIARLRRQIMAFPATVTFDHVKSFDAATFEDDVDWELGSLRKVGIQRVVKVELTKPEFDLPVVRMIVPGLEPIFGPRYRPSARGTDLLAKL